MPSVSQPASCHRAGGLSNALALQGRTVLVCASSPREHDKYLYISASHGIFVSQLLITARVVACTLHPPPPPPLPPEDMGPCSDSRQDVTEVKTHKSLDTQAEL